MLFDEELSERRLLWVPEHVRLTVRQELASEPPLEHDLDRITSVVRRRYPAYPAHDKELHDIIRYEARMRQGEQK